MVKVKAPVALEAGILTDVINAAAMMRAALSITRLRRVECRVEPARQPRGTRLGCTGGARVEPDRLAATLLVYTSLGRDAIPHVTSSLTAVLSFTRCRLSSSLLAEKVEEWIDEVRGYWERYLECKASGAKRCPRLVAGVRVGDATPRHLATAYIYAYLTSAGLTLASALIKCGEMEVNVYPGLYVDDAAVEAAAVTAVLAARVRLKNGEEIDAPILVKREVGRVWRATRMNETLAVLSERIHWLEENLPWS